MANAWERAWESARRMFPQLKDKDVPEFRGPPAGTCDKCLDPVGFFCLSYGPETCRVCGDKYVNTQQYSTLVCPGCVAKTGLCPMCGKPVLDRDMWCSHCHSMVPCRFCPSLDAGPFWRCSECGEVIGNIEDVRQSLPRGR